MNKRILLLALGLTACARPSPDAALIETAKIAVGQQLKDPSSAEYKDLQVVKSHCVFGQINAKNSFGGYVGFKEFRYDHKRKKAMIDPEDGKPVDLDNFDEQQMQSEQDFIAMSLKCLNYP